MLSDFVGLGIIATIIGFFIYTQVPPVWQTLGGFLLIVFGWVPLAILVLCVVKAPAVMAPVLIVLTILAASKKLA